MREIQIKGGLKPIDEDDRDLVLGAVFNIGKIEDVPLLSFDISRESPIKDQHNDTDFCSGYAVTDASDDQEDCELSPEYNFGKTKELDGDPESWGGNLRLACKVPVKFGSITQKMWDDQFGIEGRYNRSLVAYSDKWPTWWDHEAKKLAKESFFSCKEGPYDAFDNLRLALWANKSERRSIVTGSLWRQSWMRAEGGQIDDAPNSSGFGHAFNIVGQKMINGVPYLSVRLSNGTEIGDFGRFYFSREVVNSEFPRFGCFMFKDLPKEEAKTLQKYGWRYNWLTGLIAKLLAILKN